jgi:hypothetical protein
MTIAYVQKIPNSTTPTQATSALAATTPSFAGSVGEGDLIVATFTEYYSGSGAPPDVTFNDNKGNTWYKDKSQINSNNYCRAAIGHCIVAPGKGGSGFQVTATIAGSNTAEIDLQAIEFSGVDLSIVGGGSANNANQGTSANPSSGAIAGSGDNVYIACMNWYATATITTVPWTELWRDTNDTYAKGAACYLISSESQTDTFVLSSSQIWDAVGVAYAAAGGDLDQSTKRIVLCG